MCPVDSNTHHLFNCSALLGSSCSAPAPSTKFHPVYDSHSVTNYSLVALTTGQITYGAIPSVPQIQQGNLRPLILLYPFLMKNFKHIWKYTELPPDSIIINLWTNLFYEQPPTALFISLEQISDLFSFINISVSFSKRYALFQKHYQIKKRKNFLMSNIEDSSISVLQTLFSIVFVWIRIQIKSIHAVLLLTLL